MATFDRLAKWLAKKAYFFGLLLNFKGTQKLLYMPKTSHFAKRWLAEDFNITYWMLIFVLTLFTIIYNIVNFIFAVIPNF